MTGHWLVAAKVGWLAVGIVAYIFSRSTHRLARRNLKALRASGKNGRLELVAKSNLLEETLRVLKSVAIVIAGLIGLAYPTPDGRLTVAGIAITVVLFVVGALIAGGAFVRRRFYREFEHLTLVERRSTDRPTG